MLAPGTSSPLLPTGWCKPSEVWIPQASRPLVLIPHYPLSRTLLRARGNDQKGCHGMRTFQLGALAMLWKTFQRFSIITKNDSLWGHQEKDGFLGPLMMTSFSLLQGDDLMFQPLKTFCYSQNHRYGVRVQRERMLWPKALCCYVLTTNGTLSLFIDKRN